MVALVVTVMLAMTALALDVGHALVARNQLQNASDAAALAGARALGVIYGGMSGSLTGYTLTERGRGQHCECRDCCRCRQPWPPG